MSKPNDRTGGRDPHQETGNEYQERRKKEQKDNILQMLAGACMLGQLSAGYLLTKPSQAAEEACNNAEALVAEFEKRGWKIGD